ncbi:ligand-gated channel protein [Shewanella colwelliana]|uniref:Ligand-gated channel protein n=1 Tax=Shewanella colwelliana TaxID=23 RepID=A0A1E5IWH1_SHECO|nr:TonB-dependent receptor [Shewanella colwelliana]OEG74253.1 ligand-gated channel protein [Shewanella colwelliana]OEG74269.1 ligand-gated channel protein [Shewanella colwelliana]
MSRSFTGSLSLITVALLSPLSNPSHAQSAPLQVAQPLEQLTVFGKRNPLNTVPGSAHQLTQADLDTFKYSDILRTLASIPGVYIQEEDGFGLRPNLGMRGTGQNRSEKITIMEDGVLAAPAPYASPAAYYFPTSGRMQSIEILKGSSTVRYGPRTTGGVINLISRQIPDAPLAGQIEVAAGQHGYGKLHTYAGGQGERVGALVDLYRYQADGFRTINGVGGDSGFSKNDALAKLSIRSDENSLQPQMLEIKLKYSDESSNETYLGLTDADFAANPYQRYSASQKDLMTTEHKQLQINHLIDLSPNLTLGTTAYYNAFARNWYKTSKVGGKSISGSGTQLAADFDKDPLAGDLSVDVKANNREYLSQGLQTELNWLLDNHELALGARYHEDEMDRFQWVDKYTLQADQQMRLDTAGIPGTDSNRLDSAQALALYLQDKIQWGQFNLTAGLRYETVETRRLDWGKSNIGREGEPNKDIRNSFSALLPSLSVTYQLDEHWLLLTGVQKGFSPAAPGNRDRKEEQSWNYEAGARFNSGELNAEAILFYSDYSNMHGNCTAAQGCNDDNIGNQYNGGEVDVNGLEFSLDYTINQGKSLSFPLKLAYTYTNAEFDNSFTSDFDSWGDVEAGFKLPYLPENMLFASVAMETENWQLTLAARYTSEIRTQAGNGHIPSEQLIEAKTIVDLSGRYHIARDHELYLTAENLFDTDYVTTKIHGSNFAGKPLSVTMGYRYQF